MATVLAAQALPPDPQRPIRAQTCREALQRVREAALGSPLISAEENQKVLLKAIDAAERLCVSRKGSKG
jgi:hypothetical protein